MNSIEAELDKWLPAAVTLFAVCIRNCIFGARNNIQYSGMNLYAFGINKRTKPQEYIINGSKEKLNSYIII